MSAASSSVSPPGHDFLGEEARKFDNTLVDTAQDIGLFGISLFLLFLFAGLGANQLAGLVKRPHQRRHRLDARLVVDAALAFLFDRFHLADKRVRQAMHYALDRQAMAYELYQGYASVINSPFFAWEWEEGQAPVPNAYDYDPDMARSLLEEASWNASDYNLQMHYIPGNPFDDSLINIVQQQYADVGINYELVQVDVTEYTNRVVSGAPADGSATGDFDLLMVSGGVMGAEPNIVARYFDTASKTPLGANYGHYSNTRVDELFVEGRSTTDIEARKATYTALAGILNDEVPWIFLFRLPALYGVNSRVKGFTAPGHPGRVISSAHNWWIEE